MDYMFHQTKDQINYKVKLFIVVTFNQNKINNIK